MIRILSSAIAALLLIVGLLWWQIDRQAGIVTSLAEQRDIATARADSLRNTLRLQRELAADAAKIDRRHTEALSIARAENDRLAADVAAGKRRLHVAASCPTARVPGTASTTGVDDAGTAELDPAARQDYFALRSRLTQTEVALAGLQEWVAEVCQ